MTRQFGVLEVRQWLEPISLRDEWEHPRVERVVWRSDREVTTTVPDGYVPGLLAPYIDGERATLPEFDTALAALGLTRADIVRKVDP